MPPVEPASSPGRRRDHAVAVVGIGAIPFDRPGIRR
jgi:hypothetical protein